MGRHIKDVKGKKYNRLTFVEFKYIKNKRAYWLCKCDCGSQKIIRMNCVVLGYTKSCGCLNKEHFKKHNMSKTRLYKIWTNMKRRCLSKNAHNYKRYGGRGITICDEWKNSFETFIKWANNNGYKENLSIDRIDNDCNYEPNNCRWVDMTTQNNNRRSNVKIKDIDNEIITLAEFCRKHEINYSTFSNYYHKKGIKTAKELLEILKK